jgi:hypothetical protein
LTTGDLFLKKKKIYTTYYSKKFYIVDFELGIVEQHREREQDFKTKKVYHFTNLTRVDKGDLDVYNGE